MELGLDLPRHDRRVTWFCGGAEWVWGTRWDSIIVFSVLGGTAVGHLAVGAVCDSIGRDGVAVGVVGAVACTVDAVGRWDVVDYLGTDATLQASQRWGNTCWLSFLRKEVRVDVFDEDSFPLFEGKRSIPIRDGVKKGIWVAFELYQLSPFENFNTFELRSYKRGVRRRKFSPRHIHGRFLRYFLVPLWKEVEYTMGGRVKGEREKRTMQ